MAILQILQLIISILLVVSILVQVKGSGLGMAWGGDSSFYSTKRGFDKVLFIATIVLSILFFAFSLLNFVY